SFPPRSNRGRLFYFAQWSLCWPCPPRSPLLAICRPTETLQLRNFYCVPFSLQTKRERTHRFHSLHLLVYHNSHRKVKGFSVAAENAKSALQNTGFYRTLARQNLSFFEKMAPWFTLCAEPPPGPSSRRCGKG